MNSKFTLANLDEKLKLVAVTKHRSVEEIKNLLKTTKITRIAENRIEEAEKKFPYFPNLEKHFIGKLQSRKIKKIVKLFDVIQSVENIKQAKLISEQGKKIKIMLQINLSKKENRSGADPKDAKDLIIEIQKLPNLELIGVMGMASNDTKTARKEFALLKKVQNGLKECSMGMSNDFQIAIEEGSTMLRIGRALFEANK